MIDSFLTNLNIFTVSDNVVRILVLLALALIGRILVKSVSNTVIRGLSGESPRGKRLKTLSHIFSATTTAIISVITGIMVLKEIHFDVTPLLASAGVVGLAIGFGAQTLVKDIFSGFFLLLDGQFDEGDLVEINGKKGTVEKINLRNIEILDDKKVLHIIPSGSIVLVSNFSKR